MAKPIKEKSDEIFIAKINTDVLRINVIGTRPLIFNRMSEKVWRELLLPKPKKNRSEREANLKHDPYAEYRASVYQTRDTEAETALVLPVQMFKGAAMSAALEVPGAQKTTIGKLLWVREQYVSIFGVPQIYCTVVRTKDMNRTPDVRTRAIVPQWAASFTLEYVTPNIKMESVLNLMSAAGMIIGVGDYRQEKGKGSYGQFRIVDQKGDDKEYREVLKHGREEQLEALETPVAYDDETADLLSYFDVEVKRRGFKVV